MHSAAILAATGGEFPTIPHLIGIVQLIFVGIAVWAAFVLWTYGWSGIIAWMFACCGIGFAAIMATHYMRQAMGTG